MHNIAARLAFDNRIVYLYKLNKTLIYNKESSLAYGMIFDYFLFNTI